MKKKCESGGYDLFGSSVFKILRVMKIMMVLICFVGLLSSFGKSYSQNTKLSVEFKNTSVENVLSYIESLTEYSFMYDNKKIDISREVNIKVKNQPLEAILNQLFGNEINYQTIGKHIIITPRDNQLSSIGEQSISVSGKVTDFSGGPLPGVSVVVKGTNSGTITDVNGNYLISNVSANATLLFSFVGMKPVEVKVANQIRINVRMQEETIGIDEVIAIGYGTQRKASLTAAVSSMKTEEIVKIPTANLSNALAGRLSGVSVTQGTGTPGIGSTIRIRSAASWNGAGPLYVIDGVVRDKGAFDILDPNEVEEITILKDAASAAIYGSRASNGVVLVSTKKGTSGKPMITYTGTYSVDRYTKVVDMLDVYTQATIDNTIFTPEQPWGYYGPDELENIKKNGGYSWLDAAKQEPTTQRHAVSVSGGNDKITYYMGGSFFEETGFLPNLDYKKYNLRANITAKVTKDLTLGMQLGNNYGTRKKFNFTYDYGSDDLNNLWGKLLYYMPTTPPYIRTTYNGVEKDYPTNPGWLGNMVEIMKNGGYWKNETQRLDALLTLDYKVPFVPGLSAKITYSKNVTNSFTKNFAQKATIYDFKRTGTTGKIWTNEIIGVTKTGDPGREYLQNAYSKDDSYQLNGQLEYDRTIKEHHFNALFAYEQYEFNNANFNMKRSDFPIFAKDQFFAASDDSKNWGTGGGESMDGRLSYIGRLNYDYKNKYLFSGSVRRDGSVKFSPDKRWGWFPSISAGWRVSEEDFFKESVNFVDYFKLRASFGSTGYDGVGGWQWRERYNLGGGYYIGDQSVKGLNYGGIVNPNLTWEKSDSYNFGFDSKFKNGISLDFEYWFRNTHDILGARILSMPSSFGGSMPQENYGKVSSNGIEIDLGYEGKISNAINFFVKGNFGWATNKVKKRDVAAGALDVDNPNGKSTGYIATYIYTDMLRRQSDIDALPSGYTIFGYTPKLGMLNFQDISGINGTPDGKIDSYDRKVVTQYSLGNAPFSYGLFLGCDWKGFSVEMLFQGQAGFKKFYDDGYGRRWAGGNLSPGFWRDHWTPETPDAQYPKPVDWDQTPDHTASTFWLHDASFVRMKYLNLGCKIPQNLSKKVGLSNVQVFVSGTNLFWLSQFKLFDPEVGSLMSYPNMKTFSLGLNVTL